MKVITTLVLAMGFLFVLSNTKPLTIYVCVCGFAERICACILEVMNKVMQAAEKKCMMVFISCFNLENGSGNGVLIVINFQRDAFQRVV